jgi:hypothetical protein
VKLDYVPLLQVLREVYAIPRSEIVQGKPRRFQQYLRTIFPPDGQGVELFPLLAANPMAKEHVTDLLDALLALDADGIGAQAAAEAAARFADDPGDYNVALVVVDDLKGGWTNRYANEFSYRFQVGPPEDLPKWAKRFWITAVLWSSEPPTAQAAREAVLTAVYRLAYVQRHGPALTLRDRLVQEGEVMAMAGCTGPFLDADDIAYTREVLAPFLDADDMRTTVECLFGDAGGRTLGFTPRGLSPWAGLALALHDARLRPAAPA